MVALPDTCTSPTTVAPLPGRVMLAAGFGQLGGWPCDKSGVGTTTVGVSSIICGVGISGGNGVDVAVGVGSSGGGVGVGGRATIGVGVGVSGGGGTMVGVTRLK